MFFFKYHCVRFNIQSVHSVRLSVSLPSRSTEQCTREGYLHSLFLFPMHIPLWDLALKRHRAWENGAAEVFHRPDYPWSTSTALSTPCSPILDLNQRTPENKTTTRNPELSGETVPYLVTRNWVLQCPEIFYCHFLYFVFLMIIL